MGPVSHAEPFVIGGHTIAPGERRSVNLTVGRLHTSGELEMPVHVVHGRRPGPVLFVTAAIHGDEINGTEVIRRLLRQKTIGRLRGTLLCVPVVNVFGFLAHSRYLPDRRDLNRAFPGSSRGSLASRVADLFVSELASRATHGIDLHTGAVHRSNLPQVRCEAADERCLDLAMAFRAPLILNSDVLEGSLRSVGKERGIPCVVFEGGEALRFDEWAIRTGLRGVLHVMRHLDMLPKTKPKAGRPPRESLVARGSSWLRAPEGGIHRARARLGTTVKEGDLLGWVGDPLGEQETEVRSRTEGVVIGMSNLPLVNEGDALFHVARFDDSPEVLTAHLEDHLPDAEELTAPQG